MNFWDRFFRCLFYSVHCFNWVLAFKDCDIAWLFSVTNFDLINWHSESKELKIFTLIENLKRMKFPVWKPNFLVYMYFGYTRKCCPTSLIQVHLSIYRSSLVTITTLTCRHLSSIIKPFLNEFVDMETFDCRNSFGMKPALEQNLKAVVLKLHLKILEIRVIAALFYKCCQVQGFMWLTIWLASDIRNALPEKTNIFRSNFSDLLLKNQICSRNLAFE